MTDTTYASDHDRRTDSYASTVQMVHSLTNFRSLPTLVPAEGLLYHAEHENGSIVLAVRNDALPEAYRQGIYGFRLAQCLRLKFASAEIAFRRSLITEPNGVHSNEIHVLALDPETGGILRYISLLGSSDPEPVNARDPRRMLFPCEVAHGLNLFQHVRVDDSLDTSRIWEVKRLVQRPEEAQVPAEYRLRLTLELMLGFYTALSRIQPEVQVLIGDGEEGIALRRLLRSLRDITVVEGTVPSLPADNLMFPLYTVRDVVKPFVAQAPRGDELKKLIDNLDQGVRNGNPLEAFRSLVESVGGRLRRVRV